MSDNEFLGELVKTKTVQWVEQPPWSGFRILNTCLVLRQDKRGWYNAKTEHYEFDWNITTWRYTIVVKTIKEDELSKAWPSNMEELHKHGLKLDEDFSNTPDF